MNNKKDVKNKLKTYTKTISGVIVGYGVGELIGTVMKDFEPNAKGIKKVFIKIGAFALTGMVIKSVTDYVESEIDDIFDTIEELSIEIEKKESEVIDNDD